MKVYKGLFGLCLIFIINLLFINVNANGIETKYNNIGQYYEVLADICGGEIKLYLL